MFEIGWEERRGRRTHKIRQRKNRRPNRNPKTPHSNSINLIPIPPHRHLGSDRPSQWSPGEIESRDLDDDECEDYFAECGGGSAAWDAETADEEDGDCHHYCGG